ncbi:MAG: Eco57I restriction-modification methylase domain-containing protein, partial [Brevundimonas sp.]|nr:Eco57I restriction-modification methylase domain-containing protein [Brevundimonas sp.]
DDQIEGLVIPNHVFAAVGQGHNEATLERDPDTVLYLCARYNYAAQGDARESLSLYTLGRIFEQSITELEYKVGEIENRDTLAKLGKRKRDGVYYTPEWVVDELVRQALDPWLAAARTEAGFPDPNEAAPTLDAATAFRDRLAAIRVVDPACGSGAFLISAFRRLFDERMAAEREVARLENATIPRVPDEAAITASILADNIYGVDINPASVEIAKLALWLHSARADAPLSRLDHTLRCGNSLVGPDFWTGRAEDAGLRERVNAFDWRAAFPEVWPEQNAGGFDLVLGNPPYVKLQNLMKVDPEVVAYLQAERGEDTYRSARTGNFDLYLPFIEKGLRLLGPGGRMAYIAPSLWVVNDYGKALRALIRERRQLERWTDFRSHQIFDEADIYTSLQVFSKAPNDAVRMVLAPDGEVADIDWSDPDLAVPYEALPPDDKWLIATGAERRLIDRLARDCLRLDDPSLTERIVVGVQATLNFVYHLERVGIDSYRCYPKDGDPKAKRPHTPPYALEIEDGIMRPLISGDEAERYEEPQTTTYLLFPYEPNEQGKMIPLSASQLRSLFPKAWRHLERWRIELGAGTGSAAAENRYWSYTYPKNLGVQNSAKLIVGQTVPEMRVSADFSGTFFMDNVRVNGIISRDETSLSMTLGALNGSLVDFVFRRLGKPKLGGWFEANKQFIAPLPIPKVGEAERGEVARRARALQAGWTERRDLLTAARDRLGSMARTKHGANWLFVDLPRHADLVDQAPAVITARGDRLAWANDRFAALEAVETERLRAVLDGGGRLNAAFHDGELRLFAGGTPVLSRLYMDEAPGRLAEAYWRWLLLSQTWRDGARFAESLRHVPSEHDTPAARQFMDKVQALAERTAALAVEEREMNDLLARLYGLSEEERELVDKERLRRGLV